ncbi:MAG: hypothetical protein Ct9H300mP28_17340 [Pseudomonadota bacterium]|nr:MAG: hypothetical protein Ct9H300mP28_17340 [Pseudomonadota bacterium]
MNGLNLMLAILNSVPAVESVLSQGVRVKYVAQIDFTGLLP